LIDDPPAIGKSDSRRIHWSLKVLSMHKSIFITLVFSLIQISAGLAVAADAMPWGQAHKVKRNYHQQKAVFDVTEDSPENIIRILDRVRQLGRINNADPFNHRLR
jgi:hypothetical protein